MKMSEIHSNATGSDNVPICFIKMLSPHILPILVHLFNSIIDSRIYPSIWKKAIVTPIPKFSDPSLPKDFRPISVLPAVSKILEKILLHQISIHLDNPEMPLLAKHQSGYRRGYSTTTALVKVTHDIYTKFDRNQCTVMVLVDFSLAFNCVNHQYLRRKLASEFQFSDEACELVAAFLNQRSQTVKVGNQTSNERPVPDGTPQGSCLSALLFSLYINSIPVQLKCNYQLYADDLQLYISGPAQDVDRLIATVNEDLSTIERWARLNSLYPNPLKTQAIIFSRNSVEPRDRIVFCGEPILFADTVINLGLRMDKHMTWTGQVNDVTARVFGTLRTFRRFTPVLSISTRKKLHSTINHHSVPHRTVM